MEYVVGPVLALLLGMKFTDFKVKEHKKTIAELEAKVEKVDKEILAKSMKVILPIAQATERLQEAVGVK